MNSSFRTHAANISLSVWLLVDAFRSFLAVGEQRGLLRANSLVLGAILTAAAVFVVRRSPPHATMASPWRTAVIVASLIVPFGYGLIYAVPEAISPPLVLMEWTATLVLGWSILALRSNFSVLPHVRELVDSGPYAVVRHPIYAAYLLLDLSYLLAAPGPAAAAIWATESILLYLRARWEEDVWSGSDEYRNYRERVRWRFVPGLL